MGRKRKNRKDLPERVYMSNNAYYYVEKNKWKRLGKTLPEALRAYALLIDTPEDLRKMGQLMDRYLKEVVPEFKPLTISSKERHIKRLKRVFGDMNPDEIRPRDVAHYRDVRGRKDGKVTANQEKSTLSTIFSKAIEWGVCDKNPCREVKRIKHKDRDRYMTDDEFITLRDHAEPFEQCIMDIAYLTGLRVGDILSIKRSDIKDGELHVTTQKTGKKLIFTIEGDLEAVLAHAKGLPRPILSDYLFCTREGNEINRNVFANRFIRLKKRAGLHDQNLHFHDIRAKAATDAANQGLNAQRLLGHKNRNQTDHYIKQRQIDKVTPLTRIKDKNIRQNPKY